MTDSSWPQAIHDRLAEVETRLEKISTQMLALIKMRLDDSPASSPSPENTTPTQWHYTVRTSADGLFNGTVSAKSSGEAFIQAFNEGKARAGAVQTADGREPPEEITTIQVTPHANE